MGKTVDQMEYSENVSWNSSRLCARPSQESVKKGCLAKREEKWIICGQSLHNNGPWKQAGTSLQDMKEHPVNAKWHVKLQESLFI